MRAFPVYSVTSAAEFGALFPELSFDDVADAASFPALVIEALVEEPREIDDLEQLAEQGFALVEDRSVRVSLAAYGFAGRAFGRVFILTDEDGVERLASLSGGNEANVAAVAAASAARFLRSSGRLARFREAFGLPASEWPLLMGIVNVTPDSFYEGSRAPSVDEAVARGVELVRQGCHILDVGGASSRPGSVAVSERAERERVVPVVEALAAEVTVPISVDTFRPAVAAAALEAGARIVNDIYGLRQPGMAELVADAGAWAVLMHMKGESPRTMQENPVYADVVGEICAFFDAAIERFEAVGGSPERLVLDPGIGFGKRYEDNLDIVARFRSFTSFGLPLLVGHSRKSFIGTALGGVPPEERLEGTIAAGVLAAAGGADILRVHDVAEAARAAAVVRAVLARRWPA